MNLDKPSPWISLRTKAGLGNLVLGNVGGDGPLWQSFNLSQGLNAVHTLLMALLSPQPMPNGLVTKALVGALIWTGLAVGSWQLLVRLLRNPPMGKGRA